ncbi:MAG: DUF2339 domain-containing protein [Erythrobacter sp.]|nr:DUF2339 domain-containing protein [Erythrobacter sp.]
MEWLFIIALAAGGVWLKLRLDRVEMRADVLEAELERLLASTSDRVEASPPIPEARRAISVPSVRIRRELEPEPDLPPPVPAQAKASSASLATAPPTPAPPGHPPFRFDFEDIFGRRLPIWAGGVTLAVAGVLLVRYAIEAGLLTESVRVALAFLFGLVLLAAGELAHRNPTRVGDSRIAQAFAGAGLATLYAGFYLAGSLYGLMGQTFAFLGLAAVTGAAIGLSFRFGLPAAILGLVGGFAAPALVGGEDANLPLLALYLALVSAGLSWTGRKQQRGWLGMAALVGGLGWGALLLLGGSFDSGDIIAFGLYFVVLGAVLPAFTEYGSFARLVRLGGAALASLQLAALVAQSLHDPLAWGLYLLLGAALAAFGWTRQTFREASAIAAGIAVALLVTWELPYAPFFALVASGVAVIFAGVPLTHILRDRAARIDLWMLGLVPLAIALVAIDQFAQWSGDPIQPRLALAMLGLAALPMIGAWIARHRLDASALAILAASGGLAIWFALLFVTPAWAAPVAMIPVFAGALWIAQHREGRAIAALCWGLFGMAMIALIATPDFLVEAERLVGQSSEIAVWRGLLRWAALALVAAAFALLLTRTTGWMPERRLAAALAGFFVYAALTQIVPSFWLAPMAAALAVACRFALPFLTGSATAVLTIALLWALMPLGLWTSAALTSLSGYPVLVDALPSGEQALARLIAPALALAFVAPPLAYRGGRTPLLAQSIAGGLALVALHVLYKQIFAIDTITRFENLGLAERTVWQTALIGGGWAVWLSARLHEWARPAALALAGAGLAHYALYSLGLHNPLLSVQAVGPTPLANLVLTSTASAIGGALLLRRLLPGSAAPALDGAIMAIISIAAIMLLRQTFAGSILVREPLGAGEDLLRSLIGIVLALAFLLVGARRRERSWRIGSLVVMLIAVVKVFVFDAAGLEGLARIAGFLALGLSLIAIGWFYARILKVKQEPEGDSEPLIS